jgi:uncharacterized protein YbjT (DUF2867 family)
MEGILILGASGLVGKALSNDIANKNGEAVFNVPMAYIECEK